MELRYCEKCGDGIPANASTGLQGSFVCPKCSGSATGDDGLSSDTSAHGDGTAGDTVSADDLGFFSSNTIAVKKQQMTVRKSPEQDNRNSRLRLVKPEGSTGSTAGVENAPTDDEGASFDLSFSEKESTADHEGGVRPAGSAQKIMFRCLFCRSPISIRPVDRTSKFGCPSCKKPLYVTAAARLLKDHPSMRAGKQKPAPPQGSVHAPEDTPMVPTGNATALLSDSNERPSGGSVRAENGEPKGVGNAWLEKEKSVKAPPPSAPEQHAPLVHEICPAANAGRTAAEKRAQAERPASTDVSPNARMEKRTAAPSPQQRRVATSVLEAGDDEGSVLDTITEEPMAGAVGTKTEKLTPAFPAESLGPPKRCRRPFPKEIEHLHEAEEDDGWPTDDSLLSNDDFDRYTMRHEPGNSRRFTMKRRVQVGLVSLSFLVPMGLVIHFWVNAVSVSPQTAQPSWAERLGEITHQGLQHLFGGETSAKEEKQVEKRP